MLNIRRSGGLANRYLVSICLILAGFLAVSIFCYYRLSNINHRVARSMFNETVDTRVWQLQQELESYVSILYGAKALTDTVPLLSRGDWNNYVETQSIAKRFPSLRAVSYVQALIPDSEQAFLDKLNNQRLPSDNGSAFAIHPAPVGNSYDVVAYSAPSNASQNLIGFNQSSDPARRAAFLTAAKSDNLTASEPLKLLSKPADPGLLVIIPNHTSIIGQPVAGQSVAGFSVLSIDINRLFGSVFGQQFAYGAPGLVVRDVSAQSNSNRPFYSFNTSRTQTRTDFVKTVNLAVANRKWQLNFYAASYYGLSTSSKLLPFMAIGTADLVIILSALLVFQKVRHRPKKR